MRPIVAASPLLFAVCIPLTTVRGQPAGYYATVNESSRAALRASLHAVIDDHTLFPYTSSSTDTWDVLERADQDPGNSGNILDVNRNASYPKQGGGNTFYDRDHIWPKSFGFPTRSNSNYPYTDCHTLMLSDISYNGARGNKPYRNCGLACTERVTLFNNGQGGGSTGYPGTSNWSSTAGTLGTWEQWGGRRGDVARALFYDDVRYAGGRHGVTGATEPDLILTDDLARIAASSTGRNEAVAYFGVLSVLLTWHREDPVDADERRRNDVVFGFQGNRNPFVDNPHWVECLFGASSVASQLVRVGSPPNPAALSLGLSGPWVGATWDPRIDHAVFVPNATTDALVIAVSATNLPSGFGTLLCNVAGPTLLVIGSPGARFAIPIPSRCALAGGAFCAQGVAVDPAGAVRLTNAVDVQIGLR